MNFSPGCDDLEGRLKEEIRKVGFTFPGAGGSLLSY